MSRTFSVTYSVSFNVDVTVEDGENIEDIIQDIDIPQNDSQYVCDSFKVETVEENKEDFETPKYDAEYIISLAKYYIQAVPECLMLSSAELCYHDAISLFENKAYQWAGIRALKSLAYTIGKSHPDYIICQAKTE